MPEEGVALQSVAAAAQWQFGYKGKSWLLSERVLFMASRVGLTCNMMDSLALAPSY